MDRLIKLFCKSKHCVLVILSFALCSFGFSDSNCNFSLSLLSHEINYDYDKMIDAEKDYPTDETSYNYSLNIISSEKEFLKNCEVIKQNNDLIGAWELIDSHGNKIERISYYFNNRISITEYNNELVLDNWGSRSLLYLGKENRYYIFSRDLGIIRLIKIQDKNLFVYIVKNGKWILDPIHEGGKYLYVKWEK